MVRHNSDVTKTDSIGGYSTASDVTKTSSIRCTPRQWRHPDAAHSAISVRLVGPVWQPFPSATCVSGWHGLGRPQRSMGQTPADHSALWGRPSADHSALWGRPSADHSALWGRPSADHSTLWGTPSVDHNDLWGRPLQTIALYGADPCRP